MATETPAIASLPLAELTIPVILDWAKIKFGIMIAKPNNNLVRFFL
jgi:hypothetical protein